MRPRAVGTAAGVIAVLAASLFLGGAPASSAPERPRSGGVYIKNNIYSPPASLDPLYALGASTIMVQMNIFDGLVRIDPDRGTVAPDIAERWTHSPDGKTFTFFLRRGVLYHDGSEVTASDFKYQFERVANPDNVSPHLARLSGIAGLSAFQDKRAREISGITVVDPYTLRISMEQTNILLPYLLTGTWASAVPRRVVERLGKAFGTKPVGSGPFEFVSWSRGRELVLRANRRYWRTDQWGNRLPYLDGVVFTMIREMAAVEAEIAAGRIDSAYIRDSAYVRYKAHPLFKRHLVEGMESYIYYIGFNLAMEGAPWRDRRVRQAVNHAIDRKTIVEVVHHGKGYPAAGPLPFQIDNGPGTAGYAYDPEKARRLLAEAGYPQGFTARIISSDSANHVSAVEAAMGYLNAVGIRLQYEVLDSTTARTRAQDARYEWYFSSLGGEGHPLLYLQRAFHSRYIGPAGNFARYRNPAVDQLLDRAASSRDPAAMARLIREAERIVTDDAPWWFFSYLKGVVVHQPYVRGLRAAPVDMDWQPLEEVWLAWTPKGR